MEEQPFSYHSDSFNGTKHKCNFIILTKKYAHFCNKKNDP